MYNINKMNGMDTNNFYDVVFNPKYHYYFMGIKFVVLEAEIVRRNIRSRPSAIADLIMMEKTMGIKTDINPIQPFVMKEGKKLYYPKEKFANFVKYYLRNKYNLKMDVATIKTYMTFQEDLDKKAGKSRSLTKEELTEMTQKLDKEMNND